MASIQTRTLKDGTATFRVGWRENGKLVWSPAIGSPEGAVEMKNLVERQGSAVALATLAARSGRNSSSAAPLLREHLEDHLEQLAASATPGTVAGNRAMAARTWLPRLGAMPVDKITREHVISWVAWQRTQETRASRLARERAVTKGAEVPPVRTYSPKSIANAHGLLSGVLSSAVEAELIPRNVARGVTLPSDSAEHEMEVFTDDEWVRFIAAMQEHYRPLTRFLLATGCRIGEATAVQVRDLDLKRRTVRIRRAWKKGEKGVYLGAPKTKRGVRTLLLPPAILDELAHLTKGKPSDALVFTTAQGKRIPAGNFRNRQWERALERAGITKHITPHGLRHTSASWLLADGVSPIVVQHRLGHESLATTSKVYAHLLTDEQVGAAAVMARALPQIEG
jgi:integrase